MGVRDHLGTFREYRKWLPAHRLFDKVAKFAVDMRDAIEEDGRPLQSERTGRTLEFIEWLYEFDYVAKCRKFGVEPGSFDIDDRTPVVTVRVPSL